MARNTELIELRNKKMLERWYYWTEVRRLRFDDTLRVLSREEFFLSEFAVWQIIRAMIVDGATVDGKEVPKPMFSIYRPRQPKKPAMEFAGSLFP